MTKVDPDQICFSSSEDEALFERLQAEWRTKVAELEAVDRAQTKLLQQMTDDRVELQCKVTEFMDRVAELEKKVAEATACFEIECPCCGQLAASWAASDGDSLECGCTGQISACSETAAYANAYDCDCGGSGRVESEENGL